ncbi:YceI family protein [Hugenholtzia roseola]|uniref:YceI family protein n=1 Tax=Hugenholtzia roseola TaxID=1002 RepID=UPI0003FB06E8|nr:YceI family protein [Hugenholtzia roseola]
MTLLKRGNSRIFLFLGIGLLFSFLAQSQNPQKNTLMESSAQFTIRNAGIKVKGKFETAQEISITFEAQNLQNSKIYARFLAKSINTDNQTRDKHLRNADYFDVEKYPFLTLESQKIEATQDPNTFWLTAFLTLKNTRKSLKIPLSYQPQKDGSYLLSAEFTLDRLDFGVGESSWILSDKVEVRLSARVRNK